MGICNILQTPIDREEYTKGRQEECPLKEVEWFTVGEESKPEKNKDAIAEIIDYLNQMTGSSYRASTQKNVSLIRARLREGFTVDDFKTVIDKKVKAWGSDPSMRNYLRPVTLFGTKFESYLNETSVRTVKENSFERVRRLMREGAFDD